MCVRIGCTSTEIIVLFTCDLLFGANMNIISRTNKIETNVVQFEVEHPSAADLFYEVETILFRFNNGIASCDTCKQHLEISCDKLAFVGNVTDVELD